MRLAQVWIVCGLVAGSACGAVDDRSTRLCNAIEAQDVAAAEAVLAEGPMDWLRQQGQCLPARNAFAEGDREHGRRIAIAMLDRGLDPNATFTEVGSGRPGGRSSASTRSLIEVAATLENPALARALIGKGLRLSSREAGLAVIVAAGNGHQAVVHDLVAAGASVSEADGPSTALGRAIAGRHHATIAYLDAKGARESVGDQPRILRAARLGEIHAVRTEIASGADINVVDTEGQTPLIRASGFGHVAVVDALLAAGARHDVFDFAESAMHAAAAEGHADVIRALARGRADVNARADEQSATPLVVAVQARHAEAVAALVESGATVNQPDPSGETPLRLAVQQRHLAMVTALLAGKPAVNAKPDNGWPILHVAVTGCEAADYDVPLLEALVKSGADLAATNEAGQTARQVVESALANESRPFYQSCHRTRAAALARLGG